MTLPEIAIRRPVFAWMIMTALVVFGAISFMRLGISQLPDVDLPVVSVNMRLEGAAPEVIETEIADVVEDAVMSVQGATSVTSRSENSECTVIIQFDINRNIDLAMQDVQAKLAEIQKRLPPNVTDITVRKTNPDDQPIMLITLESNKYSRRDLMYFVSDRLKDQFAMVPGVGDISLGGYVDPNLRVWVNQKKLTDHYMTVADVIDAIQNEHSELPAGKLENLAGSKEFYVRTLGEAQSPDEFGNLVIGQRGGQPNFTPTKLKDVAQVEDGLADTLRYNRANGVPSVGLGILKQRGTNAIQVADAIRAKVAEIQKGLPEGMHLSIDFDSTRFIQKSVNELYFTLILSVLLTGLVCWMFLGSWSSTFNVLLSIPTSVIGTFIILYFSDFTLNTFTLLGLSLCIGIVVDDSIMVLENIIRHQEMGKDKITAALDGSREITFAALAATASIIAIFLPVVFMNGVIGKFFYQFGVTITAAVFLSLVEALTLTPMRCSQFISINGRRTRLGTLREKTLNKLAQIYAIWLTKALRNRWKVVGFSLVIFALSLSTLRYLNKEFIPSEDQGRFAMRLKTPVGSSLDYTNRKFMQIEKFLKGRPEVASYVMQAGGGSPGDANKGFAYVTLKPLGQRGIDPVAHHELSQSEFMDLTRRALKKFKGVHVSIQDLATRSFTASRGYPVEFTIQGPDWSQLAKYSHQMVTELQKSGLVADLDTDYSAAMPELDVIPDRKKAAKYAVNVTDIAQTVNAMIGGAVLTGRFPKNGHRYDVNVKLADEKLDPLTKINSLYVRNNRGQLISLSKLVTINKTKSMIEINRRDRERAITVYANVKTGQSQQRALDAVTAIGKKILAPQYHIVFSGGAQTFTESYQNLLLALILGLFVAYMVLASQFNSFIHPFAVLMALPFSASGAFVALLLTHQSINIYSMIGLLLLMGIVKKNSILLVDFTNQVRARGKNIREALLEASPIRLRPILMTSVATIAGALPAAISIGPGAESRIPMATAIIGGVVVSTLLTLFVVPCTYSLLARFELK